MTSGNWDAYRKAETALKKCPDMLTRIRECITVNRLMYERSLEQKQELAQMQDDLFVAEFAFRLLLRFCSIEAEYQIEQKKDEDLERIMGMAKYIERTKKKGGRV